VQLVPTGTSEDIIPLEDGIGKERVPSAFLPLTSLQIMCAGRILERLDVSVGSGFPLESSGFQHYLASPLSPPIP